ncbi:hypothetical protein [Virgibacillus necropolis]|uniref:Uncharacterized protein n=1 Tax=Virgibacillus necropolis TaxID=163877 RepID=A0A221MFE7_9BACI|nr:hypothetical protein [Virgibacillus necropolis]ASN06342.1 hypothetical protein CFK40_15600 [Virgibacillus necropolis]
MNNFITIEPVSLGELLTILSSIILLVITWKSVSNAKKANAITKQSQQLQSEQFKLSIKPDLIFDIPSIKYTQIDNNKSKVNIIINPDHTYYIKNLSNNICYNISVTTFIYLPDDGWNKYYSFLNNEFGKEKARPNIVSYSKTYALHTTNNLECTIPFYYLVLNIIAYDGTINSPELYVFLQYEDKTNKIYEDCFQLVQTGKHIGRFDEPDDIELHFSPVLSENEEIKTKLYEQKNKLESDFPDKPELHYYSL